MQDYIIKVEDDKTKYAVELFFDNYKDSIKQFINNVLRNEVGACDAEILKKEGIFEVYKTAPDKGWVLGEAPGGLTLKPYTDVDTGHKYVLFDGDKLALYLKEPEGASDLKIGNFLNLNNAVEEIESEDVKKAIDKVIEQRDAAKKVEEDLERKSRIKQLTKE